MKRYLDKGADGTTRALIDAIRAEGIEGASLLDVGGGIGAIQLELLAAGIGSVQSVEASEPYVTVARAEAERRGYGDRTTYRIGSLEALTDEVEPADVVTLDRVVCCDPDADALLRAVATRARRMVGLVYPRPTWWNRLASQVMNVFARLTRDTTRWYMHPEAAVDTALRRAGFVRRDVDRSFIWQVALYVRAADQPTGWATAALHDRG